MFSLFFRFFSEKFCLKDTQLKNTRANKTEKNFRKKNYRIFFPGKKKLPTRTAMRLQGRLRPSQRLTFLLPKMTGKEQDRRRRS
jgi:hypothetical protein